MSQDSKPRLSRRNVFAGAGTAGALAAAAVVLPLGRDRPAAPVEGPPKPDQGGGYQLTQHVLRYYETTRV